jgi:hypothetical protein
LLGPDPDVKIILKFWKKEIFLYIFRKALFGFFSYEKKKIVFTAYSDRRRSNILVLKITAIRAREKNYLKSFLTKSGFAIRKNEINDDPKPSFCLGWRR